MRLELVEDKLSLPALVIGDGQLDVRDVPWISDIGDQRYQLVAIPAIRDLVIVSGSVLDRWAVLY